MPQSINRPVLFVPLVLLVATLAASLVFGDGFVAAEGAARDGIVARFG